jgi:hypothetical protein
MKIENLYKRVDHKINFNLSVMKTLIKFALPIVAFMFASAAAITTNESKSTQNSKTMVIEGFIQNPTESNCLSVTVDCTTVNTGFMCEAFHNGQDRRVWLKNSSGACNLNLFKVVNP